MDRTFTVSWQDPMPLAAAGRSMAGIDFLRAIRDGRLPAPPIAQLLGMRLAAVEDGAAAFELTPAEQHFNPIGVVHGGIAATLLDSAMGCTVHSKLPAGVGYTTLEMKVNLVRAITLKTGLLRASARIVHFGGRSATAEGRLEDASRKLYAHASTTCIILNGAT
jgi:uncharacterized protein (TIGR00369 family)